MNGNKVKILQIVGENFIRTKDISKVIGKNEKTVRKYISEINDVLIENGAVIKSKHGQGIFLEINNEEKYNQFMSTLSFDKITKSYSSQNRVALISQYLLFNDIITKDSLIEILFVSQNTLTEDMKEAEKYLLKYNISLNRLPGRGFSISGNEYDIRVCLLDTMAVLNEIHPIKINQYELDKINQIIKKNFQLFSISLSPKLSKLLVQQIEIAIIRKKNNDFLSIEDRDIVDFILKSSILQVGLKIIADINNILEINLSKDDARLISLSILTKLSSYNIERKDLHRKVLSSIDSQIEEMLDNVENEYSLNFKNNSELKENLFKHLIFMLARVRFNIFIDNPITSQLKNNFSFSFAIAKTASEVLEKHYNRSIPEGEIGFLAMIFSVVVDHKNKKNRNILFVCASGMATSRFYRVQFENKFGDYINRSYECSVENIENFPFDECEIDLIFSSIAINKELPRTMIRTSLILAEHEIETYKNVFLDSTNEILHKFYKEDLFISSLKSNNKEEIINELINKIDISNEDKEKLFLSVMRREKRAATDISGIAATPHPEKTIVDKNIAVVGVLNQPIIWDTHRINLVILVNLKRDYNQELESFYQKTTNLLFNHKKVAALIRNPTFTNFMTLLSN